MAEAERMEVILCWHMHQPEYRDLLVVRISGASARAFVQRAQALVAAGRPPCPLCALPLDPEGHVCPRQNGYRRRS